LLASRAVSWVSFSFTAEDSDLTMTHPELLSARTGARSNVAGRPTCTAIGRAARAPREGTSEVNDEAEGASRSDVNESSCAGITDAGST
jgi:hypothetical protein